MASRLKYFSLLLAACAVIGIVIMRTGWWQRVVYPGYTVAEQAARERAVLELRSLQERHREVLLFDSLHPRIGTAPNTLTIEQSSYSADSIEALRAHVMAEIGDRSLHARIGVFLVDHGYGAYTKSSVQLWNEDDTYFAGEDAAGPYCIAVITLPPRLIPRDTPKGAPIGKMPSGIYHATTAAHRRTDISGPCRFWARYGRPGVGVEGWLRQGGYHYASAPAEWLAKKTPYPRRLLGVRYDVWSSLRSTPCKAGDKAGCRTALRPAPPKAAREIGIVRGWAPVFGENEAAMLAVVEQSYGSARFEKFWTSDAAVETAFAQSFGADMYDWVRDFAIRYYGPAVRGPGVDALSWFLSLATILTFAGLSIAIASRRRVA